jgi:uroporphyrinogen-III synthase
MFGSSLQNTRLAAISPITADTLTELGHPPAVVAEVFTTAGLADALLAAESRKP